MIGIPAGRRPALAALLAALALQQQFAQVVKQVGPSVVLIRTDQGLGSCIVFDANGDVALAIGNPLGLQSSVTEGIVSALGRTVNQDNGVALPDVIQTSAPINPGNSGGALVDLQGQVIGIPTLAATDPQLGGGAAAGIGFAIPSNTVRDLAAQLIGQGRVTTRTGPGWAWRWPPPPAGDCWSPRSGRAVRPPGRGSRPASS